MTILADNRVDALNKRVYMFIYFGEVSYSKQVYVHEK